MAICGICDGAHVPSSRVVDGADDYAGTKVHLVDTGPGHGDLAVHPVDPGFTFKRLSAPIKTLGVVEGSRVSDHLSASAPSIIWSDVSEWQTPVNNTYIRPVLAYRLSLSTTKTDNFVAQNHGWAEANSGTGKHLIGHIGYHVYYPGNWKAQVDFSLSRIGNKWGPRFAWMMDIESWGGQVTGNHSSEITAMLIYAAQKLGSQARVCAYGNQGDLAGIYPTRPSWLKIVVADYGGTPSIAHSAHQYTDGQWSYQGLPVASAPFGKCDHNVAWSTAPAFQAAWFPAPPAPKPVPTPTPTPTPTTARRDRTMFVYQVDPATIPKGGSTMNCFIKHGKSEVEGPFGDGLDVLGMAQSIGQPVTNITQLKKISHATHVAWGGPSLAPATT